MAFSTTPSRRATTNNGIQARQAYIHENTASSGCPGEAVLLLFDRRVGGRGLEHQGGAALAAHESKVGARLKPRLLGVAPARKREARLKPRLLVRDRAEARPSREKMVEVGESRTPRPQRHRPSVYACIRPLISETIRRPAGLAVSIRPVRHPAAPGRRALQRGLLKLCLGA